MPRRFLYSDSHQDLSYGAATHTFLLTQRLRDVEDGAQAIGNCSGRGFPTDKVLINAEAVEPVMQPLGPAHIGVIIGDKSPVFVGDGLSIAASALC
jgi:hypothetical protein